MDEGGEVDVVVGEAAHIALARIAQEPLRAALPAPVEHGDGKAARAQIAHGLEIFLDEFGAAGKQAHGALAARRRIPARKAQLTPSGVFSMPETTPSGTGLAGMETRSMAGESMPARETIAL